MQNLNDILQAVLGMQQTAQANLPVIPNNGNPAGAHNMPNNSASVMPATTAPRPAQAGPDWLQPSPAMETIKQILASMGGGQQAQPVAQPMPAVQTRPVLPMQPQMPGRPILPIRNF